MTTPMEQIDGTKYGARKAFSQLATLGLMALMLEIYAPVLMGEAPETGGEFIAEHLQWVNRIPWLTMGIVLSLCPPLFLAFKKVPRGSKLAKSVGSVHRPDILLDASVLQHQRENPAYLHSGSDRQREVGVLEDPVVLDLSEARRRKLGDTNH